MPANDTEVIRQDLMQKMIQELGANEDATTEELEVGLENYISLLSEDELKALGLLG